jgi:hypothetical protein
VQRLEKELWLFEREFKQEFIKPQQKISQELRNLICKLSETYAKVSLCPAFADQRGPMAEVILNEGWSD